MRACDRTLFAAASKSSYVPSMSRFSQKIKSTFSCARALHACLIDRNGLRAMPFESRRLVNLSQMARSEEPIITCILPSIATSKAALRDQQTSDSRIGRTGANRLSRTRFSCFFQRPGWASLYESRMPRHRLNSVVRRGNTLKRPPGPALSSQTGISPSKPDFFREESELQSGLSDYVQSPQLGDKGTSQASP